MVEEKQLLHEVNGGAEVEDVEKAGKVAAESGKREVNGVVNGNGNHDDVEGSYVFVGNGNGNNDAEAGGGSGSTQQLDSVVKDEGDLELDVAEDAGSGDKDLDAGDAAVGTEPPVAVHVGDDGSQHPEILSDRNQEEGNSDVCDSVAVKEADDCPVELPPSDNGEGESEGTVSSDPVKESEAEPVTDDCSSVTVESQLSLQEADGCPAELPLVNNGVEESKGTISSEPIKKDQEPPVSTIEVNESDSIKELKTENQSPSDSHQDPLPPETTSLGISEGLFSSFDCCCVPVGNGLNKSSPLANDNIVKSVAGEWQNLDVSFDCCSVPVGSSETISSAVGNSVKLAVGPTVIEDSEGSRDNDDKPVAENKTLDVQSSSKDTNICGEVATIPSEVENVPISNGSENSKDVMESAQNQHIPVDDMNEASGLIDLPEKEERKTTSSSGGSNAVITVEGKSGAVADAADKDFDVPEDMDGDIISDGKPATHTNNTTVETEGLEESARNEKRMPTGDMGSESTGEEAICSSMDVSGREAVVSTPEAGANQAVSVYNNDKTNCQESEDRSHKDEAASSSREIPMVAEVETRPFYFLARHPRFEDTNLREQLDVAQLEVDEKTRERDAIRTEIQDMRSTCRGFNDEVDNAISKERGMRELLRSKRQEMDSLQSMMNRVKNAISVEDIDGRIHNLLHMIEHETLHLNEEKQFIREINQLKQQRAQLSTNVGKGDEVQKAMDEKDKIEERLKALKKEADAIRIKLSRFEDDRKSSKNKYSDENKKLSELQAKFRAANDIRQTAYKHLQSLRKQLYEKNKYFRGYKDDLKTVENYTITKNKQELHHYCVNQVESFMDLWDNNAEFRKEYIRCNTRSTIRRLGTMDGRSLGPEEKPAVLPPVIMYNNKFAKVKSVVHTSSKEQEKWVATVEAGKIDDKPAMKVVEQKVQTAKSGKSKKSAPANSAVLADSSVVDVEEPAEMSSKQSKEEEEVARREIELARREEELRKEEEAARLKELRRLEEKVKAKEALERKKRQAEKAQARAALRAQKEAEERERERERRAKKKEKKKTALAATTDRSVEVEFPPTLEDQTEDVKELESKGKPNTVTKKPQRPSHFTKQTKSKSIPLPLRSRNKKRMQPWMWHLAVALLVFALFLLGNSGLPLPFGLERFGF